MNALILPIALGVIMLSLGISLTIADFKRALLYPKAVITALICQIILMPVVCFFIVTGFGLGPELAVGLMLLSASPGGATANLYSHLAGGDVALNITLTAINSVLSIVTIPVILGLSLQYFMGTERAIPLQTGKVIFTLVIVIIPVVIGMIARHRNPALAKRMEKPLSVLAALCLLLIITVVLMRQWNELVNHFPVVGAAVTLFNVLSLAAGYSIALLLRLEKRQAIAIGMEVGMHNTALVSGLALTLLNNPLIAMPPSLYGILTVFIAAAFGFAVRRKKEGVA